LPRGVPAAEEEHRHGKESLVWHDGDGRCSGAAVAELSSRTAAVCPAGGRRDIWSAHAGACHGVSAPEPAVPHDDTNTRGGGSSAQAAGHRWSCGTEYGARAAGCAADCAGAAVAIHPERGSANGRRGRAVGVCHGATERSAGWRRSGAHSASASEDDSLCDHAGGEPGKREPVGDFTGRDYRTNHVAGAERGEAGFSADGGWAVRGESGGCEWQVERAGVRADGVGESEFAVGAARFPEPICANHAAKESGAADGGGFRGGESDQLEPAEDHDQWN